MEHVELLAVSGGARFGLGRIVCGIGECGDGGVVLAAGRWTFAAVRLVNVGAAPDP